MDKKKPEKKDPLSVYTDMNKLPLILQEYRSAAIRTLRDKFIEQLKAAKQAEVDYCNKHNVPPAMTIAMYNEVCTLVTRCKNIFEVEALARYVFDMNEVPNFEMVQSKARDIEAVFPWKVKF
jgi:hypothetical protein